MASTPDDLTVPEVWRDLHEFIGRHDRDHDALQRTVSGMAADVRQLLLSHERDAAEGEATERRVAALEEAASTNRRIAWSAVASFMVTVGGGVVLALV